MMVWGRRGGVRPLSSIPTAVYCVLGSISRDRTVVTTTILGNSCHTSRCNSWRPRGISRHYSSSSVNLAKCKHAGCPLGANFGWADEGKTLYCSFHQAAQMTDVTHPRCEHPDCDILGPVFGYVRKKGVRCLKHKEATMINVMDPRCEQEGCDVLHPAFNVAGSKRGRFCDNHRTENCVDVRTRRCGHEGCDVHPRFGFLVAKESLLANLKLSGMKFQKYTKCKDELCSEFARFGSMGEPLYCPKHKLPAMKDFVSKRCLKHKLEGMIDLKKKCKQKGCTKHASFGMPGGVNQYCGLHKLEGMIQYKGRIQAV